MPTNQAPPSRVRAVARVGAAAPPVRGTPQFAERRRPGRIGAVSILQLMVVETVLVAIAIAFARLPLVGIGAVVVGVFALLATFGRSRGRWWIETMGLRWQQRRRRAVLVVPDENPQVTALRSLVPDLTMETAESSGGERVGVGRDGAGWFAAAVVLPPSGMRGDAQSSVPLDGLARVLSDSQQDGVVVQVVTHTVSASGVVDNQAYGQSYRELVVSAAAVPASDQVTWVAVRVDMEAVAAAAMAGDGSEDDVPDMVATLVRQVAKRLKRAGLRAEILDTDGLLEALTRSTDLAGHDPRRSGRVGEDWSVWRSAHLSHACFWIRDWPGLPASSAVLNAVKTTPAAYTTVSIILEQAPDGVDMRCLVRAAAPDQTIGEVCRAVRASAKRAGATLFRLNGEHAPAVYATAPTGGGAR
jgi:type VII secretion protein EccE